MDIYQNIRNLIENNKLKKALDDLSLKVKENNHQQEILVLKAAYNSLEEETMLGLIPRDYEKASRNRLNYSVLQLISKIEAGEANEPIWSEAVKCQEIIETSIVNLSKKIEGLMGEMISNDVVNTLKHASPKNYKEIIKVVVEKHKKENAPYLNKVKKTLNDLVSVKANYKDKVTHLVNLLENKPNEITKEYIKHRHKETQISFYKEQIDDYKKLYKDLRTQIKENSGTLKFFMKATVLVRVNDLQDVGNMYNKNGYDILGYNHSGINSIGYDMTSSSILASELNFSDALMQEWGEENKDLLSSSNNPNSSGGDGGDDGGGFFDEDFFDILNNQ